MTEKDHDWVIYRLLYLILALDPSMAKIKDVELAIHFVGGDIRKAFDLLKQEHGKLDTFNDKYVASMVELQNTVSVKREYVDDEEKDFMQRRVFGLSKSKFSSGVIQEIVDKINLNMGERND